MNVHMPIQTSLGPRDVRNVGATFWTAFGQKCARTDHIDLEKDLHGESMCFRLMTVDHFVIHEKCSTVVCIGSPCAPLCHCFGSRVDRTYATCLSCDLLDGQGSSLEDTVDGKPANMGRLTPIY